MRGEKGGLADAAGRVSGQVNCPSVGEGPVCWGNSHILRTIFNARAAEHFLEKGALVRGKVEKPAAQPAAVRQYTKAVALETTFETSATVRRATGCVIGPLYGSAAPSWTIWGGALLHWAGSETR